MVGPYTHPTDVAFLLDCAEKASVEGLTGGVVSLLSMHREVVN